MSTDTAKVRSKLAKLNASLDELESQLEPLFVQSLPETLLALDTIQQAKLQVIIPYVVYDLVFVYLKSRGIDPKTHRVVAELERVRQYFDKIKQAEDSDRKRKLGLDKAAAERFIKHAIAQAKSADVADVPEASSSSNNERVPVKVTSKMMARAEYEKELEELRSEEDDDLEVFDEELPDKDGQAMDVDSPLEDVMSARPDKGKGRASEEVPSTRRKRPRIDPFSGHDDLPVSELVTDHRKRMMLSPSVRSTPVNDSSRGTSVSASEDRGAKKAAKKAKHKARKS